MASDPIPDGIEGRKVMDDDAANDAAYTTDDDYRIEMARYYLMDEESESERIAFDAITEERARQDRKWGGPLHDDTHSMRDWCRFIVQQVAKASEDSVTPGQFRDRMIKVGALAVAAFESSRRTT